MQNIDDFDLSEPLAKTLISYAVQTKNSINAQSQIVEEALIEFFERHRVKIETQTSEEPGTQSERFGMSTLIFVAY